MQSQSVPTSYSAPPNTSSLPMTIEALHGYMDVLATRDSAASSVPNDAFTTTSRFLGSVTYTSDILPGETTYQVMVRCVYPPNTQSRHAVICVRPSTSEWEIAWSLYHVFGIRLNGGVIMNVASVWMKAVCSPTNNGPPTLITSPGNPVNRRNLANILELLGTTKQGILQLAVISEEEFALCPSCNQQGIADPAMLQRLLTRCIDVRRVCVQCAYQQGFPTGAKEAILRGTHVNVIRG